MNTAEGQSGFPSSRFGFPYERDVFPSVLSGDPVILFLLLQLPHAVGGTQINGASQIGIAAVSTEKVSDPTKF